MTDRYLVNTHRGEPAIRTNDRAEAEKWAAFIGAEVIDLEDS